MGNRFGAWRGAMGGAVGLAILCGAPVWRGPTRWRWSPRGISTGAKSSWWVGDAASPTDEAMREGSAPVGGRWRNPEGVQLAAPVSKVFLRHDLSVNNGRALAGVYGATHALVGHVQWRLRRGSRSWGFRPCGRGSMGPGSLLPSSRRSAAIRSL